MESNMATSAAKKRAMAIAIARKWAGYDGGLTGQGDFVAEGKVIVNGKVGNKPADNQGEVLKNTVYKYGGFKPNKWCAMFVSACGQYATKQINDGSEFTSSGDSQYKWAGEVGKPYPGVAVAWKEIGGGTGGHVELVVSVTRDSSGGWTVFHTIGGNTGRKGDSNLKDGDAVSVFKEYDHARFKSPKKDGTRKPLGFFKLWDEDKTSLESPLPKVNCDYNYLKDTGMTKETYASVKIESGGKPPVDNVGKGGGNSKSSGSNSSTSDYTSANSPNMKVRPRPEVDISGLFLDPNSKGIPTASNTPPEKAISDVQAKKQDRKDFSHEAKQLVESNTAFKTPKFKDINIPV